MLPDAHPHGIMLPSLKPLLPSLDFLHNLLGRIPFLPWMWFHARSDREE
jgi:hypothetical protein